MTQLTLPRTVFDAIRAHGEDTYPHECCGVLLSSAGSPPGERTVVAAVRAANHRTDSAHNRYEIAPAELVRIEREARRQGLDVTGFYHSHPDHPALWSPTDLAEAHWIGSSYMITAVDEGKAAATHSFRLAGSSEEDKHFQPETIEIIDSNPSESDTPDSALSNKGSAK